MRLIDARIGDIVRVVGVTGRNLKPKLRRIGLYPGDELRVLQQAPLGGPIMVSVGGRELALGRGVAEGVLVEAA